MCLLSSIVLVWFSQCANIVVYVGPERTKQIVGCLGVVHPEVLTVSHTVVKVDNQLPLLHVNHTRVFVSVQNFELTNPCSLLEMDIEFFLNNKFVRRPDVQIESKS